MLLAVDVVDENGSDGKCDGCADVRLSGRQLLGTGWFDGGGAEISSRGNGEANDSGRNVMTDDGVVWCAVVVAASVGCGGGGRAGGRADDR